MADLSLDELKALSAVATHRSFRGAATGLDMPPSSLSHLVAAVEKQLGVRLFNRTTRSVSVTEAGEAFLARVRPALLEIVDAVETVNRFRSRPAGTVRINTSEAVLLRVLPIVLEFMTAYPEVKVDLIVEGRFVDIVAEGFDAGLRPARSVPQDMVAVPLDAAEETAIVATPDYLARRGVPRAPADLLNHECIRNRLPSGVVHRWEFERHGEVVRLDPPGRLTLSGMRAGLRAARAGIGLAYVTERSAREDIAAGRLIHLLPEWTPPFPGICLYYARQRLPSPAFKSFLDYFRRRSRSADQTPKLKGSPNPGVSSFTPFLPPRARCPFDVTVRRARQTPNRGGSRDGFSSNQGTILAAASRYFGFPSAFSWPRRQAPCRDLCPATLSDIRSQLVSAVEGRAWTGR